MPRRLRFYQRKGEQRRIPKNLTVSINTEGIQLPNYTVSVPLEKITLSSHRRLTQLYEDLINNNRQLPTNWTVTMQTGDVQEIICQKGLFLLKISTDMKWSLEYQKLTIYNTSCILLSEIPPVIYSVDALVTLLSVVDGAHLCIGNPDPSYIALSHKGRFLDQPGKIVAMVMCYQVYSLYRKGYCCGDR